MYITYSRKETKYHVAVCRNCEASMTMTDKQFQMLHRNVKINCLELFDTLVCCDSPFFTWYVKDVE